MPVLGTSTTVVEVEVLGTSITVVEVEVCGRSTRSRLILYDRASSHCR